ncbi:MAG: hypothetical protein ACOZF0_12020 [Thermodesulfobacteriota bacterium]
MLTRKQKIALLIAASAAFLFHRLLTPTRPDHIPFYGVWKTSDPTYQGCYMEITPKSILFGKSDSTIDLYRITRMEERKKAGKGYYTVYYKDQDGEMKISFEYREINGGEIRISHQENILWTLSAPAGDS